MGIYDRDYYRTPHNGGVGQVRVWSVNTWLLVINIAVFVVEIFWVSAIRQRLAAGGGIPPGVTIICPLQVWGEFTIAAAIRHFQAWRVITCQFLHTGIWHLGANMLGLWLLGPVVEEALGARRYLLFYLLCGVAGPVMYTAFWTLGLLGHMGPAVHGALNQDPGIIGASAGIFGVLLAAAYLSPDRRIDLYFFELTLKYFAWIMMAVAAYTVLVHGNGAGGQAAHLGGGLLGWILVRHEPLRGGASAKKIPRKKKIKDWSKDPNR